MSTTDSSPPSRQEVPTMADHRRRLGAWGEAHAARHLVGQGMVVLDRNWRCEQGELDLVLRDGDVLVICEVKTRTSFGCGTPLEAITPRKFQRLQWLGHRWLREHAARPRDLRIDFVGVLAPPNGPVVVDHVPGVFQ